MGLASSRKAQPQTARRRTGTGEARGEAQSGTMVDDLAIVPGTRATVKSLAAQRTTPLRGARRRGRPGRRKTRRQSHGSAWHWKQTDCWYYTLPGTKKRVTLFDEDGQRIRGWRTGKPPSWRWPA